MAHQDERAGQHLLQKVQRLEIEIVGGLVEDQQVGGFGQGAGEHDTAPFTARQRADRCADLGWIEQKVFKITCDMSGRAADGYHIADAAGQDIAERRFGVQAFPGLIQSDHLQISAELDLAGIRLEGAGQHVEQCGFARTVGSDDAELIAPHNPRREIPDNRIVAITLPDEMRIDDNLAGSIGLRRVHNDVAGRAAFVLPIFAQVFEGAKAAHIAFAPGRDALAHPFGFPVDFAVEFVPFHFGALQEVIAPVLEFGKAFLEAMALAVVDPHGCAREVREKATIMADQDQRRTNAAQGLFQKLDRRQVEMVCRLVHQQDIGVRGQRPGERGTPYLATR